MAPVRVSHVGLDQLATAAGSKDRDRSLGTDMLGRRVEGW